MPNMRVKKELAKRFKKAGITTTRILCNKLADAGYRGSELGVRKLFNGTNTPGITTIPYLEKVLRLPAGTINLWYIQEESQ